MTLAGVEQIMPVKTHIPSVDDELQQLKLFVRELFPAPDSLVFTVPETVHEQELQIMRQSLRTEQFFIVVDFVNLTIVNAAGLEEIGYDSTRFTFRQYLSTFPSQGMLQLITMVGKQAFALSQQSVASFMKPNYISHIPITAADGQVMLAKRTLSPWQFTSTGKLTSYVAEFTILKPYENEPMNPRIVNADPTLIRAFNAITAKSFANLPAKANLFAPKEIDIMRLYVDEKNEELTARELAGLAGVAHNTLNTYNKLIIGKAKAMFGDDLPVRTAKEVAVFLQKSGLLA